MVIVGTEPSHSCREMLDESAFTTKVTKVEFRLHVNCRATSTSHDFLHMVIQDDSMRISTEKVAWEYLDM